MVELVIHFDDVGWRVMDPWSKSPKRHLQDIPDRDIGSKCKHDQVHSVLALSTSCCAARGGSREASLCLATFSLSNLEIPFAFW